MLHVDLTECAEPLNFGVDEYPPHLCVRMDDLDVANCSAFVRIYRRHDDVEPESVQVPLPSLTAFMSDMSASLPSAARDFRVPILDILPPTQASRRSIVVEGLENFGRNLIYAATPGSIRSHSDTEQFSTLGKRSKMSMSSYNQSTVKSFSSAATSISLRSRARTPSLGASVILDESVENQRSPSPNKAGKKPRPASFAGPSTSNETPTKQAAKVLESPAVTPSTRVASVAAGERSVVDSPSPRRREPGKPLDLARGPNLPSSVRDKQLPRTSSAGSKRAAPDSGDEERGLQKRRTSGREEPSSLRKPLEVLKPSASANTSETLDSARWERCLKRQQYRARERKKAFSDMRVFMQSATGSRAPQTIQQQEALNKQLLRWLMDAERDFGAEETDLSVLLVDPSELPQPPATPAPVQDDAELQRLRSNEAALKLEIESLRSEAQQLQPLKTKVLGLERKCELLTALEADGRLENTELHKAFNEELDKMYEDTLEPEDAEVKALRVEVQKAKAARNELSIELKTLRRDLEIQKTEAETYRSVLKQHRLL